MSQFSVPWVERPKREYRGIRGLIVRLAVLMYRMAAPIVSRLPGTIMLVAIVLSIALCWVTKALFDYVDESSLAGSDAAAPLASVRAAVQADGWPSLLAYPFYVAQYGIVRDIIGLVAIIALVSINAMYFIWWERKVAGRIQSRVGPMRVGGWHGWAQSPADGLKLLTKEDLIPADADRVLFRLAPYLAFVPALTAFVAVPFGVMWVFRDLDVALIFVLAMLGIEVFGVILAGWASNNKWSVYGAMREACQMVSYEIPMGASLLVPVMTAGTLSLTEIGQQQAGGWFTWLAFRNPFVFAAALTYYIASLASCKRAPFDLPESESELVAGFHTEYSGFRWSLFFFAEYAAMFVVSALATILFFGAWNGPFPLRWADGLGHGFGGQLVRGLLSGPVWFLGKCVFLIYVQMWIRWTLPRIRIDQVLYACVQVLLPAAFVVLLGNTVWLLFDNQLHHAFHWFSRGVGVILGIIGIVATLAVFAFAVYGFMNRRRLVGTLAIDVKPGW